MDNEVHHFHRRIDDAEPFGHLREGVAEELVVQLDHDLLLARRTVDAFGAQLHAVVEALQGVGFLFQAMFVQGVQHFLHGLRHRVVSSEAILLEQGVEHRLGDQVLGQHLDDLTVADAVVEIVAQFFGEVFEGGDFAGVGRVFENAQDAADMSVGDLGDVARPVFPVMAVADLLDDPSVDGALDFAYFIGHFRLLGHLPFGVVASAILTDTVLTLAGLAVLRATAAPGLFLHLVGDGDDFHLAPVGAVEVELVDGGVEAVIVGAQGLQHLPDDPVDLVVVQRFVGRHVGWDHHRQHDVAAFLTGGVAHHSAHRLHHVHLGVARGKEQYGIQGWHIHAFGQAAHVAEDAAGIGGRLFLQPGQLGFLLTGIHAAIDVFGLADQAGAFFDVFGCLVGLDHRLEHAGDIDGADLVLAASVVRRDDLTEGDGTLHRLLVAV